MTEMLPLWDRAWWFLNTTQKYYTAESRTYILVKVEYGQDSKVKTLLL